MAAPWALSGVNGASETGVRSSGRPPGLPGGGGATGAAAGSGALQFTPGALATVRQVVVDNPITPHLFRMRYRAGGGSLWRDEVVREGNVGTPMIVVPTCLELPAWSDGHPNAYTSDHRFIQRVTDLYGVVWRKEIICIVR